MFETLFSLDCRDLFFLLLWYVLGICIPLFFTIRIISTLSVSSSNRLERAAVAFDNIPAYEILNILQQYGELFMSSNDASSGTRGVDGVSRRLATVHLVGLVG